MPRNLEYRDLDPLERRCALMRAAGMSEPVIGRFIDTDAAHVGMILKRPRVARYLIALEATFVDDLSESAKHLTQAIENEAVYAFHVEKTVMDRLFTLEDNVRAQLGAASTAQDILDRAGKRAPTKVQTEVTHTIDAEALAHVASVLQEVHGTTPAIDVTNGGSNGRDEEESY